MTLPWATQAYISILSSPTGSCFGGYEEWSAVSGMQSLIAEKRAVLGEVVIIQALCLLQKSQDLTFFLSKGKGRMEWGKPLCILNSFDSELELYVKYHDSSLFILLSSEQAESLAAKWCAWKTPGRQSIKQVLISTATGAILHSKTFILYSDKCSLRCKSAEGVLLSQRRAELGMKVTLLRAEVWKA